MKKQNSPRNNTALETSVHKKEKPQPQLSNDRFGNKFKSEQKGQPTNKQQNPRNEQDQMQEPQTDLSNEEKFKFLQSIDVEVRNLEDKFNQV